MIAHCCNLPINVYILKQVVVFVKCIFFFFLYLLLLFSRHLLQANFNARDGRVMIFNLVEAAQEFLSEIAAVEQPVEPVGLDFFVMK